jgi:hypothetical protein
MVPVPAPAPYLDPKKHSFQNNFWKKLPFDSKLFYKEKIDKFHQLYCKMEIEKNF